MTAPKSSREMLYLLAGSEPEPKLDLLLSLTRITSEPTIAALKLHYTTGLDPERCAARHFIELSNLMRAQTTLNNTMGVVEAIKEIDWEKHLAKLAAANVRIVELEQLVSMAASYMNGNELLEQHLRAAISDSKEHAA
ncbi:hypothetical protein L5M11_13100 [Shewanella sp. SM87]|uniref:hypothetical protein n=1 Tax=Shewanella sp. SM87 TaxID=2912808 RepID=UPI0021DA3FCB|nr:hypothetical protein [Shewanella sp. SM87]MCU8008452.1 hypothetical protein [Shewanella sp. SM87]